MLESISIAPAHAAHVGGGTQQPLSSTTLAIPCCLNNYDITLFYKGVVVADGRLEGWGQRTAMVLPLPLSVFAL